MAFDIFITVFLVFLNGFFVAAEFAIVKVRSTQLNSSKHVAPKLLNAAKTVTNHLDNYLAATQLGITLASLGLGWVGENVTTNIILKTFDLFHLPLSPESAHRVAIPVAFIFITVLHIVFGELAPKAVAIRKAVPTTLMVALPLRVFYFVFKPFIWLLNGFANLILRAIGIDPVQEQDIHTEEEIRMIITESEEGGAIEETERTLIQNVFDFDDRRLKDIYTHRKDVVAIDVNSTFEEIINTVVKEGYSRYPVYEESEDELKGILSMKDILPYILDKKEVNIQKLLRPVVYVPEGLKIKDLLRDFQKDHIQMAIVTDEYGEIVGLVTMEDILEELVGDIQDEHDSELPIVEEQSDNTFIVDAHENLDDVNKLLPVELPVSEEYNTLSGLITYHNETVPEVGEKLLISDYEITILSLYRSSVEKVQMRLLTKQEREEKEEELRAEDDKD